MRVIFQSAPIRVSRSLHSDTLLDGTAYFVATAYDAAEQEPPDTPCEPAGRRPVSYWRSAMRPGEPMQVGPAFDGLPTVEIPRALVEGLPDEARLELSWIRTQLGI